MAEGDRDATAGGDAAPVFISYASQDAAVAAALVETLERHGIACWIAPRDVKAGALYADAIVRAISGAKAFVLVLSEGAIASTHVSKEIERASSKKRPIIALRVDAAALTPALEYFLSESQWLDARAGNIDAAYVKLIDAISEPARAASETLVAVAPGTLAGTVSVAHRISCRTWIALAVGLVVVAALAALLADKFWGALHTLPDKPTTAPKIAAIEKSIAVLPFIDLSEKHDQEYFGDGMAEEIINILVTVPELKVIGRTSSFQFKGKTDDLRQVGLTLGAAYVVEGSVRRSGEHIRVTAQLIDNRNGAHRWSKTFDSEARDAIEVQDEIATAVVRALEIEVRSDRAINARGPMENVEAYESYLRGLQAGQQLDRQGLEEAAANFRRALELDPRFAPAAEQLALVLWAENQFGFGRHQSAREAAEAALKIDSKSAIAHAVLGHIYAQYEWNWEASAQESAIALSIAPNDSYVVWFAASERLAVGAWKDAGRYIDAGLAADPLDPIIHHLAGGLYSRVARMSDAEREYRRALEIAPNLAFGHYWVGVALLLAGKTEAALTEMQNEPLEVGRTPGLALVYAALGRPKDSDVMLSKLERRPVDTWGVGAAYVYAFRHENDRALVWLQSAYKAYDPDLYLIKGDPLLRNLETDPRFKLLLRKMNLPEE
jgi:TolB-like protein